MTRRNSLLQYIVYDLLASIPNITSRPMFSGYGLYKDGVIFGIIADDQVYFKVDDSNLADFKRLGSQPFTYHTRGRTKPTALSYWQVPAAILEDRVALTVWVNAACTASQHTKLLSK